METVTIELTKEEAALLPLLYKVPVKMDIEAIPQAIKTYQLITALVDKAKKAFEKEGE